MLAKANLILVLISASLLFGCGKSDHNQSEENVQLRAYRLIDANKVDDAISLLSAEIDSRDQNAQNGIDESKETTDLRVTLASAYAKKSGIRIFEIAKAFEMGKKISSFKLQEFSSKADSSNNPSDKALRDISKLLMAHLKMIQTLSIIPQISQEKADFLLQAVRVLNSSNNLEPADLIYSAILKVILVRTMLESDSLKFVMPKVVKENNQCVANLTEFRDHLTRASKILLSGYEDIGKAMPEKKKEVENASKAIVELTTNVASVNAAGVVLHSLNTSSLDSIYNSIGVGSQVVDCESNEPIHQ